jgi:hypothetical protein
VALGAIALGVARLLVGADLGHLRHGRHAAPAEEAEPAPAAASHVGV